MQTYTHVFHTTAPVYDSRSEVLILGTFPSVKSRETGFFYGHPQNRFWRVLSSVLDWPLPETVEDKKRMLLDNRIALWDVIAECDVAGSSDSSIRHVRPHDVRRILDASHVTHIYVNGATAERLYRTYLLPLLGMEAVRLPSTSPANASWSLDRLCTAWRVIRDDLTDGHIAGG